MGGNKAKYLWIIIVFIIFLGTVSSFGQSEDTVYCTSISEPHQTIDVTSDIGSDEILNRFITARISGIMKMLGLGMNFIVRTDDGVKVAKAKYNVTTKTKYIDFNLEFFQNLQFSEEESLLILAHEVAHHLNFDLDHYNIYRECIVDRNQNSCRTWQAKELAADLFSGNVLFKFGVKRNHCTTLISSVMSQIDGLKNKSSTHPTTPKRVQSFLVGFDEAEEFTKEYPFAALSAESYRNEAILLAYDQDSVTNMANVIELYSRAIELNPSLPLLYAERGYFYGKLDNVTSAIEDFQKAVSMDSSNPIFFFLAKEIEGNMHFSKATSLELKKTAEHNIKELQTLVSHIK